MRKSVTPERIDELLPQTQCGLCGQGGCMPYAEAIVYENAPINLCPPGGIATLKALGELLEVDSTPYLEEMAAKAKPKTIASIREAECIGCTKCIAVCPVDAIIGSAKSMHTIITDLCTGCELCVPPCPVDCIDLLPLSHNDMSAEKKSLARDHFNARHKRLAQEKRMKEEARLTANKKKYIQDAILRAKEKRRSP